MCEQPTHCALRFFSRFICVACTVSLTAACLRMAFGTCVCFLMRLTSGMYLNLSTSASWYSLFAFSRGRFGVGRSLALARQMRTFVSSEPEKTYAASMDHAALKMRCMRFV